MIKDITNKKFGKLTAIEYLGNSMWKCQCECGNISKVNSWNLRNNHTTSCGCMFAKYGGKVKSDRLYRLYRGIIQRCEVLRKDNHNRTYIEKGIKVCDEWKNDFNKFKKWALDNGYDYSKSSNEQTIDRINPYGNYEPNNCRFITRAENNSRESKKRGVFCLTKEQIKEIRMLYSSSWCSQRYLAEKFNVSKTTISKVIKLTKEELTCC